MFWQTWLEIHISNEAEIHRIFGSSPKNFLTAPWAYWLQQVPAGLPVLQPPFHRHLQSQFGEMFNSTRRSQVLVVGSENQTPAHLFTLENLSHKLWVMVKSCKEDLLNWASLDEKKSKKHPWLVWVKTCFLVWACWHKEKLFVESTSLEYRVRYQKIPTAFQLLCGKCLHVGVFYCDNCNIVFSMWLRVAAVARMPLAGHGAMPLFVLG